jgi:hypothetical protein
VFEAKFACCFFGSHRLGADKVHVALFISTAARPINLIRFSTYGPTETFPETLMGVLGAQCSDEIGTSPRYRSEMGSVVKYEMQLRLLSELIDLFLSVGWGRAQN